MLLILICLIAAIGAAYSLPPLKFKMHHIAAAIAISLVRGLLVNIGFILYFTKQLFGTFYLPMQSIPLIFFISVVEGGGGSLL